MSNLRTLTLALLAIAEELESNAEALMAENTLNTEEKYRRLESREAAIVVGAHRFAFDDSGWKHVDFTGEESFEDLAIAELLNLTDRIRELILERYLAGMRTTRDKDVAVDAALTGVDLATLQAAWLSSLD